MYEIYELPGGTYRCVAQVQDGTERWTKPTLEEAVKSMKRFAVNERHGTIKRKDIAFFRAEQVVETKWAQVAMPKGGDA